MNNRRYRIVTILLIFFLISSQSFSLGKEDEEIQLQISYSVMNMSNPYFQSLVNGCRDRVWQLGHKLTIADAGGSVQRQFDQIEEFIRSGADLIICSPVNPEALYPLLLQCREAGIPFINANQEIKGADAHIIIDEYAFGFAGGEIAGEYIRDHLDGRADVLILTYPEDQIMLKPREQGMIDGIVKSAPQANIVDKVSAHTPEAGLLETERALDLHPSINVIASLNDAAAIGAYESAVAHGWSGPEYCIVGLDATEQAIIKMKHPDSIYRGTVDIDPYGTGKLIIDTALLVYETGPLDNVIHIPMKSITAGNIMNY